MNKELPFIILCIEEYKIQKKLSGKEVVNLFNKYSIFKYLKDFYTSLHVMGIKYIISDIDSYINNLKNKF